MEFKDYYATLGVARDAAPAEIKRAYRKLARKYHPDVSKEPNAEAQFKEVNEAHKALNDVERRAAYDEVVKHNKSGRGFSPPPGWDSGFEFSGSDADAANISNSDFFEALFGRQPGGAHSRRASGAMAAGDHHAKVQIELMDAYRGASRAVSLRVPQIDANGQVTMHTRTLEVNIPKGIRGGQHLRLAGQGGPGFGDRAAGDLYLEIEFAPTPLFRVDGRDVYLDLAVAPWEAALGAVVAVPTPEGSVQMTVPSESAAGLTLRLRGKGIPGGSANVAPGDLYAVLSVALPQANTGERQEAYRAMAKAFDDFQPRPPLEGRPL